MELNAETIEVHGLIKSLRMKVVSEYKSVTNMYEEIVAVKK